MSIVDQKLQLEDYDHSYIWHPFTQMKDYIKEKPLIIEKGKGSYLWDIYGNKYLDGISSLWVTTHGHCRKEIDDAIIKQISKVSHATLLGLSHSPGIELAKKVVEISPKGLTKVFYSENGSSAVEIALKIAFQYWLQHPEGSKGKKQNFISLKNAYHGDTLGAVSVGGIDLFHEIYHPLLFESVQGASPYCYRCEFNEKFPLCNLKCLDSLDQVIRKYHKTTAAMIIEPMVQGAAGILVFPPGFLKGVRQLCTKYNILLIADEIAVGIGRTGKMFACEHEDVSPDIMTIGKGITGGYLPLALTLTRDEIYNAFLGEYEEHKTFFHGHTYTGNPLACAAALANLKIFEKDKTLLKLTEKIDYLKKNLVRFTKLNHVGDVRQLGFMVGIELVADKNSKKPFDPHMKAGIKVIMDARERGLILRPLGDVIVLMPHLSITIEELDELLDKTFDSICHVMHGFDA